MRRASRGEALRTLLKERTVVLPGVFNAFSALLVEAAGFDGVYVSGAGLANGLAGLPDVGLLSREEVARQAQYIQGAVSIPALVDVDTGFGEGLQIERTIQVFEWTQVAGVQIEDQVDSKRCGHLSGKSLISTQKMIEKLKTAIRARSDDHFLIVARTDARAVEGLESAILRAKAYRDAGADLIFPEALESEREFERFAKEVPGWLVANMTEFGKTPFISVPSFAQMGYVAVIFPMTLFRVMAKAAEQWLGELRDKGTQRDWIGRMQTREELYRLLKYEGYQARDRAGGDSGG